ncbi:MAG: hypothetical protein AAB507_01170 [Patescibacteria group bacterium]
MRSHLPFQQREKQFREWFKKASAYDTALRNIEDVVLKKLLTLDKRLKRGCWVLKINHFGDNPRSSHIATNLSVAISSGGIGYNYAGQEFYVRCRCFAFQQRTGEGMEIRDEDIDFSIPRHYLMGEKIFGEKTTPISEIFVGQHQIFAAIRNSFGLRTRVEKVRRDFRELFAQGWQHLRT